MNNLLPYLICAMAGAFFGMLALSLVTINSKSNLEEENEQLKSENKIYEGQIIQNELDISRLEKDLKDARKTKTLAIGFDFEAARNELTRKGDAL